MVKLPLRPDGIKRNSINCKILKVSIGRHVIYLLQLSNNHPILLMVYMSIAMKTT